MGGKRRCPGKLPISTSSCHTEAAIWISQHLCLSHYWHNNFSPRMLVSNIVWRYKKTIWMVWWSISHWGRERKIINQMPSINRCRQIFQRMDYSVKQIVNMMHHNCRVQKRGFLQIALWFSPGKIPIASVFLPSPSCSSLLYWRGRTSSGLRYFISNSNSDTIFSSTVGSEG